ncbi:MAG: hypothetical protein ACREEE_05240 [Dongiaceae bacterium]
MSIHRYQMRNLWSDYARGGAGIAIGIGGWSLAPTATHVIVVFGALTALFLLFTLRTFARQRSRIELSEDGISTGQMRRTLLRWQDLSHVKLRYFSTRRHRANGWMVMNLAAPPTRISLDSNIDGFDVIAARVARAARENRLKVDGVSAANLAALGLTVAIEEDPIGRSAIEESH